MPTYKYKGRNMHGEAVAGTLALTSEKSAREYLRLNGLFVTDLLVSSDTEEVEAPLFRRHMKMADLVSFSRQFAGMVKAGVPIVQTLDSLADQTENPLRRAALQTEGPNMDEIKFSASCLEPVLTPDGKADFSLIYQQSGVRAAPFTAEQMLEMLESLPSELPLDTKRQTVKVTLNAVGKTIGATPETIVADASRKLAALTAYLDHLTKQTTDSAATAELEIGALQARIEEKRKAMTAAHLKQAQMRQLCDAESDRLDDVQEFFSLEVSPSKAVAAGEEK